MPEASCDNHKVCRHYQMSPGEQNHPHLRAMFPRTGFETWPHTGSHTPQAFLKILTQVSVWEVLILFPWGRSWASASVKESQRFDHANGWKSVSWKSYQWCWIPHWLNPTQHKITQPSLWVSLYNLGSRVNMKKKKVEQMEKAGSDNDLQTSFLLQMDKD